MELFRYPVQLIWLLAGFAALVLFYFRARASAAGLALKLMTAEQLKRLSGEPALRRKIFRDRLYLAALLALAFAAAGPQWGMELAPVTDLQGNLVIAVDTSASMGAKDLKPSRLANAKLLLNSLIDKFPDYRIGIVAFSGEAFVQCPLTTDSDALKYFLSNISTEMLPVPGTNLAAAIETSGGMLGKYTGQKIAVLITDGEDHSGRLDGALNQAGGLGLKIFTVGLGKTDGELIPVQDGAGNFRDYKKDTAGKTVVTKLDENALVDIARKTGAEYIRYGGDPEATAADIHATVARIGLSKSKGFGKSHYKNRFIFPLVLAILLLLIELMVMEKGFTLPRALTDRLKKTPGAAAALLALLLPFAGAARAGEAETLARKGNSAYAKEDFPKAYEYYNKAVEKAPKTGKILFNRGASYYRLEDYPKAAEDFEEAAKSTKTAGRASYNAGNAYYRLSDFPKAIESYKKAILADPGDENAKYNLQKALEQKRQQEQKKKDQQKQCDKPQDKDDQKQDKKGGGKDEKKEKQDKDKEKERRKEQAKQQAEKLLELMKEKEKSSGQKEMINARFMNKAQRKEPPAGKDW